MAVKVIVRGDSSGDYEFLVKSIRYNRCCYDDQILELLDSEGNLLYTIPFSSVALVQYIQDDENLKLEEFVDEDYITQICFDNNISDATIECTRVDATKIMDTTVIDAYQFLVIDRKTKQEQWFHEFTLPLNKLKFINHNYNINTEQEEPEQEVEEVNTPATPVQPPTEHVPAPKTPNPAPVAPPVTETPIQPVQKHKSRFNKK